MRQAVLGIGFAVLVATAVLVLLAGPEEPVPVELDEALLDGAGRGIDGSAAGPGAAPGSPGGVGGPLPDGSLPPILGDPRPGDLPFCDDALWSNVEGVLVAVRPPGEALVDERAWTAQGVSARVGIASWISKCHLDGAPVELRGDVSGAPLGRYDPALGWTEVPGSGP